MTSSIATSTKPTPFIMTNRASHMITTSYFLNNPLALLTFLYIGSILPIFYLFLEGLVAALRRMGLSVAFVAYAGTAFGAFSGLGFGVGADDD